MVARGEGKILITGSIAGLIPGSFQAVYNGTKAFIDSFSDALAQRAQGHRRHRHLPDAGRDRHRVLRARRHDRHQGRHSRKKDDPADVARTGWEAMKDGKRSIVHGLKNKLQVAAAKVAGGGVVGGNAPQGSRARHGGRIGRFRENKNECTGTRRSYAEALLYISRA